VCIIPPWAGQLKKLIEKMKCDISRPPFACYQRELEFNKERLL